MEPNQSSNEEMKPAATDPLPIGYIFPFPSDLAGERTVSTATPPAIG